MKFSEKNIDWKIKRLKSIAVNITAGATPSTRITEYWENGTIPWMSSGEINLRRIQSTEKNITQEGYNNSSTSIVPKKSVLMALAGQGKTRGKVAVNEIELCTNQSLASIVPGPDLYFEYLFHNLDYRYNELRRLSTGEGGRGGLNLKIISSLKIPLPPLQEQKQIADILSTWDHAIELKDKLINKKMELLDATIQRYKRKLFESIDFDKWTTTKLKRVFSVRKDKDYESEEQPLYSFTIEKGVSPKTDRYNRSFLVKGDKKYKVTKYNDLVYNPANLKYGAISVNKNPVSVLISPIYETLYIKDTNKYDIDFFKYFLTTSEMIRYYKSKVEGTLVERSAVKVDQFLLFSIDVPEYNVQKQVTNHLNTIDKSIDILKRQKEMLELQKKGLMQRLLTGQVRVQV
jgi:type I restriction enzyme S subunit